MSIFQPNIQGFGNPVYSLSTNAEENMALSAILNEAMHVYDFHKEGIWVLEYKDGFAKLLVPSIQRHPKLIRSIIALNNRVFSMVVYRAVELARAGPIAVA